MTDTSRETLAALLPTPFFSSFAGRAHEGDLSCAEPVQRAAAWAHWAVASLSQMTGWSDRSYAAMTLPGRFYDPKGTSPVVAPHLEVSEHVLRRPDPQFPDRLAQAGNGLLFGWWVVSEVTAVRRALFSGTGPVGSLLTTLTAARAGLIDTIDTLACQADPRWSAVEHLLVTDPQALLEDATGDFSAAEVAAFFPAGAHLNLHVKFDAKLRSSNEKWAARRVGVWQLRGTDEHGKDFALGVVTPRLTENSMLRDPLFAPDREAPAALLVRGLVLSRLLRTCLGVQTDAAVPAPHVDGPAPHLRAVAARVGHKLPEASLAAAALFVRTFPSADEAWEALTSWAGRTGCLLMVNEKTLRSAYTSVAASTKRAEDPDRDAVNDLLPLAWDERSRVVRLTFVRPAEQ